MKKNVIVLTLSLKYDAYCIAAYDAANNEIIRLVKDNSRENGIPKKFAKNINLLDEVEINIIEHCPKEHQTENVLIDIQYGLIKTGKRADIQSIYNRLQVHTNIFGNNCYKLSDVSMLEHSLEIIKFNNMEIYQNENNKTKANFTCNLKKHLRYSVTDPYYYGNRELIRSGYAIVSLPASDYFTEQNGFFKYISAIYPD